MDILIVDDHIVLRNGLKSLLLENIPLCNIKEASTGYETISRVKAFHFDVCILDVNLPDMNGFVLLKKIKEEKPNQKCIFFTMYSEYSYLKKAIHEDIGGYVLKNNDPSELIMCVNQVVDGKKYYSNEVSQVLLNVQNTPEHVRINNLYNRKISERELQVLKYISKQFTNEEIAEKLFLSKRTIDTYRQRLLEKLGVKNTAGLVKFVYDNQIEIP